MMRYLPILLPLAAMACTPPASQGQTPASKQELTSAEYAAALDECSHKACDASKYGAALEQCTRTSKTCVESIDCENKLRTVAGRPLRAQDGCK